MNLEMAVKDWQSQDRGSHKDLLECILSPFKLDVFPDKLCQGSSNISEAIDISSKEAAGP